MSLDPQTTAWLDQEDAHLARTIRQHLGFYRAGKPYRLLRNGPTD